MTSTTAEKKQPRHKKRYLVAVLIVAVSLASIGLWWVAQKQPEPVATENPLANRMLAIEQRMTSLKQQIKDLAETSNDKVKLVESNQAWWLVEVERYLVEAGERVKNGASARSALAALKSARSTLEGIDLQDIDATAIGRIKGILDQEILSLEKYENPAAKRAVELIDNTIRHLERSAMPDKHTTVADAPIAAASNGDGWSNLTERLKRMVVVETQSGDELQRLNRGLVVHSLMLAKTAIAGSDARSYHYAVANALQMLEQSDAFSREVYGALQTLQSIDITPSPPYAGKALREVRLLATEILP